MKKLEIPQLCGSSKISEDVCQMPSPRKTCTWSELMNLLLLDTNDTNTTAKARLMANKHSGVPNLF